MSCLCHYGPALLIFWFQTYLGHENSASYLKTQAEKTFWYHGQALVTLYVQFLCSDWSKFDRWVHAENLYSILKLVYFWQLKLTEFCLNLWCFFMSFSTGCTKWNTAAIKSLLLFMAGLFIGFLVEKCSILKLVYFDSWSWQTFLSTCDVFLLSFPTGCTKWNTAAINCLLLFMAGLFTEFLVEKCAACQSHKSDFGWHRFHFSPCWMRVEKSLKRLSGAASRMVSLE